MLLRARQQEPATGTRTARVSLAPPPAEGQQVLLIDGTGHRFCVSGGRWVTLGPGTPLALIFAHLLSLHEAGVDAETSVSELALIGWNDPEAARGSKVRMTLSRMRERGLDRCLVRGPFGYRLDPALRVVRIPDEGSAA
jgi:hypothetical protein